MRDADVRRALVQAVAKQMGERPHVLVPEVEIRWSVPARMDALLVSHRLYGFEIKSDVDSLSRLPRQIEAYGAVVERAVLVVGPRHLDAATKLVPAWWNIWAARPQGDVVRIRKVRGGRLNPTVSPLAVTSFMTREDLLGALRERSDCRLSALPIDELRQTLVSVAGPRQALKIARTAMMARPDWRGRSMLAV